MPAPVDPRLNTQRERLFHWPGIIAVAIVVTAVLYIIFPRNPLTLGNEHLVKPDALSLSYMQIMLRAEPDNHELRLILVNQLKSVGQMALAYQYFLPLVEDAQYPAEQSLFYLQLELLAGQVSASTNEQQRKQWQRELADAIGYLLLISRTDEPPAIFHKVWTYLEPEQRIRLLRQRLAAASERQQRRSLLRQLAELYHMQGRPMQASQTWATLYSLTPASERREIGHRWLDSILASGKPARALPVLPLLLKDWPKDVSLHQRAVDIALQNERVELAIDWLSKLVALEPGPASRRWQLFDLYLGQGNIESARRLVDQLDDQNLSPARSRQLAQLMDWVGEPDKALNYWRRYLQSSSDIVALERLVQLALALNEHQIAREGLLRLARQRAITDEERDLMVGLHIKLGDVEGATAMLERELTLRPSDVSLLDQLVTLYQQQYEYRKLQELLARRIQQSRPMAIRHYVLLAQSYQKMLMPEQAWRVLSQVNSEQVDEFEYWSLRLQLAQFLEKIDDAAYSLEQMQRLSTRLELRDRNSAYNLAQLLALEGLYEQAARLLYHNAEGEFADAIRLQAISFALDAEQWSLAQSWLAELPIPELQTEKARYWAQKARLAQGLQHYESARLAWQEAVQLAPQELAWQESLIWLLMRQPDAYHLQLRQALEALAQQADATRFVPILAWGYMALQEPHQALTWFRRGLEQRNNDWQWLSGMAQALTDVGLADYAWRLQQRVFYLLEQQAKDAPLDESASAREARMQLARNYQGEAQGWLQWTKWTQAVPDRAWQRLALLQALSWALADGETTYIGYLLEQASQANIQLPGWQALSMALLHNDRELLQRTLDTFDDLPVADKMVALDRLGRWHESIALGLATLTEQQPSETVRQVRRILVGQRARHPSGYRLSWRQQGMGDLVYQQSEFYWRHQQDEFGYWFQYLPSQLKSSSLLQQPGRQQSDVQLGWHWHWHKIELESFVSLSQRFSRSIVGAGVSLSSELAKSQQLQFGLEFNQRSQLSAGSWLAGVQDQVYLQLNQRWDTRVNSTLAIRRRELDDLTGNALGQSLGLELGASYQLFLQDPAWQANAAIEWHRFERESQWSPELISLFNGPLSEDSFLPKHFARLGVSTTWYHGRVHDLNHQVPAPRWHVTLDVGYQWLRDVTDFGLQTGVGWRVFGDDELGFSYQWQSENALGNPNWTFWLSYNRALGR